jgi:phosphomevalonate kinase
VDSAQRIATAWRGGSVQTILDEYRDYTHVLREFSIDHGLGIFDAGHAELADAAAAAGVIYKPCGAGGGDVGVVFADDEAAVEAFVSNVVPPNFRALKMSIDRCGVQVDREEH